MAHDWTLRPVVSRAGLLMGAALMLAGCNETGAGLATSAPVHFVALKLPPGAGCANEIATYQSIIHHDLETGNVAQSVYDAIERELASASKACDSGRDSEARALVAASKERHGYHS